MPNADREPGQPTRQHNLRQRVISALWGVPLVLLFVWLNTPWFPLLLIFIAAIAVLGGLEFYKLASLSGGRPLRIFGLVWIFGFVVNGLFDRAYTFPLLASAILISLVYVLLTSKDRPHLVGLDWSWTVLGILYVGWMLGHYVALRELAQGREWVLVAILSTMACDTTAFFVGRAFGRHNMAPRISPKKTWEGAAGGFAGAIGAAFLVDLLLILAGFGIHTHWYNLLVAGALVGVFSQIGDLWESVLKRRAGVKDSGSLIAGHGGILDRFDGVIFAGAVVYYYVLWVAM